MNFFTNAPSLLVPPYSLKNISQRDYASRYLLQIQSDFKLYLYNVNLSLDELQDYIFIPRLYKMKTNEISPITSKLKDRNHNKFLAIVDPNILDKGEVYISPQDIYSISSKKIIHIGNDQKIYVLVFTVTTQPICIYIGSKNHHFVSHYYKFNSNATVTKVKSIHLEKIYTPLSEI